MLPRGYLLNRLIIRSDKILQMVAKVKIGYVDKAETKAYDASYLNQNRHQFFPHYIVFSTIEEGSGGCDGYRYRGDRGH